MEGHYLPSCEMERTWVEQVFKTNQESILKKINNEQLELTILKNTIDNVTKNMK